MGATSGIGAAVAEQMADEGTPLILAGRDVAELTRIADDLRIRFEVAVTVEPLEARDFENHAAFVDVCLVHAQGDLAGVVLCHGYLGSQERAQEDPGEAIAKR